MLIMMNKIFGAKYVGYEVGKSYKSNPLFYSFFSFFLNQYIFYYISISICSVIVGFVSIYQSLLQFCNFFWTLNTNSKKNLNYLKKYFSKKFFVFLNRLICWKVFIFTKLLEEKFNKVI